ncbi:hypothetical protein K9L67_05595 [Candidatus Woesearchaeota archaeon]|nr:hypothetical protein [Candidatus Woesearchaeota archaeon]MCF7901672.1 hypothetical protein [Candidatus Woesearchaeota archaeon]MCF8013737.1 hypothetical protein [Candidatus Woesearchaeota archaeon]
MELNREQEQKLKRIINVHSNNYMQFLQIYESIDKFIKEDLNEEKDRISNTISRIKKKIKI